MAGINLATDQNGEIGNLVMLDEQYRMDPAICQIVSQTFYDNRLKTHPARITTSAELKYPAPLRSRLVIVDTSRIFPFTTRDRKRSHFNLMHAIVIRNLALYLQQNGFLSDNSQFGACTPFSAQASLLKKLLGQPRTFPTPPRVGTVHSFQGDEQDLIVFDLVDSIGERHAGLFLQANSNSVSGAKLLNVALSRAKQAVVIVGNLTFLDQKLPGDAILRNVLHTIQQTGQVIDAEEILRLYPFAEELRQFSQAEIDPDVLRSGVFHNRDFESAIRLDMQQAERSIVVFSGFITTERASRLGDVFRERIAAGVKVRCVTRPPQMNGTMPVENGNEAITALLRLGVAVDLRHNAHEKVVMIDGKVIWVGSLNPLSHTERTSEIMLRVADEQLAEHLSQTLSILRRPRDADWNEVFASEENPRCPRCGGVSVYKFGRFGGYFECFQNDGWRQNVDAVQRRRRR